MNFNEALGSSLNILYNYSKNFNISIDLVQKLSQLLTLDTFIDVDAYAHIIDQPLTANGTTIKFQRLSIAGSLILIDIDYVDSKILRVSFSAANVVDAPADDKNVSLPSIQQHDDVNVISIDFSKDKGPSILTKDESGNIEQILLSNLTGSSLGNFPSNLKFLANLDRLSSSHTDLFIYIDSIALILNTLYRIETEKTDAWLVKEGLQNAVGKIVANDKEKKRIGIFIEFWRDFKHINHEYNETSEGLVAGEKHVLLIDFSPKDGTSVDYIGDIRDQLWHVDGQNYQFSFDDDSYMMSGVGNNEPNTQPKAFPNCALNLTFDGFVYLPITLLEFLGIRSFERSSQGIEVYDKFIEDKEIILTTDDDKTSRIVLQHSIPYEIVPVKSLAIKRLSDIPLFLKVFRNFLVLTNILNELRGRCSHYKENKFETALEATNRLKDSLKLDDVADEQLLSLGALNTQSIYANVDEDISLDQFMGENNDNETKPQAKDNSLYFNVADVSFGNNYEVSVTISGKYRTHEVSHKLVISNGTIQKADAGSDGMNVDDEKGDKFVRSLELTEDLLKSLNFVYVNALD